jgi:hypothetical protein
MTTIRLRTTNLALSRLNSESRYILDISRSHLAAQEDLQVVFAGHTTWMISAVGTGETPLFVNKLVPSISPISRNNPAFQVYQFEGSTSAITSYQTYYLANLTTAERPTKLEDLQWLPEYDFVRRIAKRGWTSLPCVQLPAPCRRIPLPRIFICALTR